jgi:hypothetical protein
MTQTEPSDIDAQQITRGLLQVMRLALREDSPEATRDFNMNAAFARTLEAMDRRQTDRFLDGVHCVPILEIREEALMTAIAGCYSEDQETAYGDISVAWKRQLMGLQIALLTMIGQGLRTDPFGTREQWGISHRVVEALKPLDVGMLVDIGQRLGGQSIVSPRETLAVQVGMDLEMSGHSGVAGAMVALNQLCTVRAAA